MAEKTKWVVVYQSNVANVLWSCSLTDCHVAVVDAYDRHDAIDQALSGVDNAFLEFAGGESEFFDRYVKKEQSLTKYDVRDAVYKAISENENSRKRKKKHIDLVDVFVIILSGCGTAIAVIWTLYFIYAIATSIV